ncbi:Hypothetical protein PHPALM_6142 [Phytophthora palmivora]|uniref:Uncharacterized protein n=1 Tax=Phytophthora palmivora TaxID=4796 RepID=A0A2P4YFN6_9STRA|nr:Hypothetical protein PHPALM_6142 [Phytophthora palmivora]
MHPLENIYSKFVEPMAGNIISATAVVDKSGSKTTIRVINNYSFPGGVSVNDFTSTFNFPTISYDPPRDIARRIFALRKRHPGHPILMMLGDMSGMFRHIPMNADHVHMFTFRFEGFVVLIWRVDSAGAVHRHSTPSPVLLSIINMNSSAQTETSRCLMQDHR